MRFVSPATDYVEGLVTPRKNIAVMDLASNLCLLDGKDTETH